MPDAIIKSENSEIHHGRALSPLPNDDRLISAADLPAYIGLAFQTLARLRHEGKGPPFVRVGRRIYYRASDVTTWLNANTIGNRSSY